MKMASRNGALPFKKQNVCPALLQNTSAGKGQQQNTLKLFWSQAKRESSDDGSSGVTVSRKIEVHAPKRPLIHKELQVDGKL